MTALYIILSLYLLIKANTATMNLTFTNCSAYFKQNISASQIISLQNNEYMGISANMSFSIQYIISNKSENILVNDLLSTCLTQTLQTDYSIANIGNEQIIIYHTQTISQQSNHTTQFNYTTTVFAAILTYTMNELQNINTFILTTFENELEIILNNTLSKNIKSFKSVTVNKHKTKINNVLIDINDLYDSDSNDSEENKSEKELLFVFIGVSIVMVLLICCFAMFIMKRKFNGKFEVLEESLLENKSENESERKEYENMKPEIKEYKQIELQSKDEIETSKGHQRKKISSYDWETPGYNGSDENINDNAPDAMDNIDHYLNESDDENEDMYAPSEITNETPQ